jgi:D-alanyl-D-alanine dipeptidase
MIHTPLLFSLSPIGKDAAQRAVEGHFRRLIAQMCFKELMKRSLLLVLFCAALVSGCQHGPPKERGPFRQPELVELVKLEPSLRLEIRYATTNNFMKRPVYRQARAFLQRPAAAALVRANQTLRSQGYGLLIFDAYRPWSVTKKFWDFASPEERRIGFVADPREGSKHNRGCAVDLTLFELGSGREVAMPSTYDEFSERAYSNYQGGSAESRRLRAVLRQAMEAEGFEVLPEEWWHFNYKDWNQYPILNIPFEAFPN